MSSEVELVQGCDRGCDRFVTGWVLSAKSREVLWDVQAVCTWIINTRHHLSLQWHTLLVQKLELPAPYMHSCISSLPSWIPLNPYGFWISTFSSRNLKPTSEPMIQLVKQKPNSKTSHALKPSGYKVLIKFQQLATCIQWGDAHSVDRLYNGLTKHIKDDMVQHTKPTTLAGLQKLVQAIDAQYWEWKGEVSCKTRASRSSGKQVWTEVWL